MYLGIDLGGTNIDAGLVSDQGLIVKKKSISTRPDRGSAAVIDDIINLSKSLSKSLEIQGLGIGIPGTVIKDKGMVDYACNINFNKVYLTKALNQYLNYPIYLDNDANCAALGEALYGAAKDFDTSMIVTIGTGIGGGVIINKKIYRGFNGAAGEIGHMVIKSGGLQCSCGRKGCFEKYASTTALENQAKNRLKNASKSLMLEMVAGQIDKIDGKIIFSAAEKGDEAAQDLIQQYIDYLAEGFANLINIFEPEIIVIGGGISRQGEHLLKPLKKETYKRIYSKHLSKTKIVTAALGSDAGIIGAANLWKG